MRPSAPSALVLASLHGTSLLPYRKRRMPLMATTPQAGQARLVAWGLVAAAPYASMRRPWRRRRMPNCVAAPALCSPSQGPHAMRPSAPFALALASTSSKTTDLRSASGASCHEALRALRAGKGFVAWPRCCRSVRNDAPPMATSTHAVMRCGAGTVQPESRASCHEALHALRACAGFDQLEDHRSQVRLKGLMP
jgi:hypothetical protein